MRKCTNPDNNKEINSNLTKFQEAEMWFYRTEERRRETVMMV